MVLINYLFEFTKLNNLIWMETDFMNFLEKGHLGWLDFLISSDLFWASSILSIANGPPFSSLESHLEGMNVSGSSHCLKLFCKDHMWILTGVPTGTLYSWMPPNPSGPSTVMSDWSTVLMVEFPQTGYLFRLYRGVKE